MSLPTSPVSLNSIADIRAGYWGEPSETEDATVPVSALGNGDLLPTALKGTSAHRWFTKAQSERAMVVPGDIVMTSSGDCGKLALIEEAGFHVTNFVKRIRVSDEAVSPLWLFYILQSPQAMRVLSDNVGGATISNLRAAYFDVPFITLVSSPDQERATERLRGMLGQFERLKDVARRRVEASRAIRESVLAAAFRGDLL